MVKKESTVEILLKFQCPECRKTFIVDDAEVEDEELGCPHCREDVPVPEDDD